jgi:hypothetical protein
VARSDADRLAGQDPVVFFRLTDWELAIVLAAVVGGGCFVGAAAGAIVRRHADSLREPLGVVNAAVLGVVGLVLAFGLTLAIGRYEERRMAVVNDANTIDTTYLRAQTLREPERSLSLPLFRRYASLSLDLSHEVPDSEAMHRTADAQLVVQRRLWRYAGRSLAAAPLATAPRLYVESLNEMIDQQTTRLDALKNRVPGSVLALEVIGAGVALALLAAYLSVLGRGHVGVWIGAALVTGLLLVTFDLDRPTRGLIKIPTAPLTSLQAMLAEPPAAAAP